MAKIVKVHQELFKVRVRRDSLTRFSLASASDVRANKEPQAARREVTELKKLLELNDIVFVFVFNFNFNFNFIFIFVITVVVVVVHLKTIQSLLSSVRSARACARQVDLSDDKQGICTLA